MKRPRTTVRARAADSSERLARGRAILEAAERFGPGALDLLTRAAHADEYWAAIHRERSHDRKKVEREIADAIKNAPPDVNPLLLSFVLRCVEIARKGEDEEPPIGRAVLRDALAAVVPPGRRGKRMSRIPLDVFTFTASTPADVALLARKGIRVDAPADPVKRDEQARKIFGLTTGALRTAKTMGRKVAREFPDVMPPR